MATELTTVIEEARERFSNIASQTPTAIPLNFEREKLFALQLLSNNSYTQSCAERAPQSFVMAIVDVAAVGLSLNPVTRHAYLVPRDGKVCLDIGAFGYAELGRRAGLKDLYFGNVYERDEFVFPTAGVAVRHVFDPFIPMADRGQFRGSYCQHVNPDGSLGQCVALNREQITKRMQASDGWKAHHTDRTKRNGDKLPRARSCIWCSWPEEMSLKTVLRYARRWWPQTPELVRAVSTLAANEGDDLPPDDDSIETTGEWICEPPPFAIDGDPGPIDREEKITSEQASMLAADIAAAEMDAEILFSAYRPIRSIADLPADKFEEASRRVAAYAAAKAKRTKGARAAA